MQKLERKDPQSPYCLPTALLYHYLAFPFKEKGNSFQRKVLSDMPSIRRQSHVCLKSHT
jgi:hypothetical protein